MLVAWMLLAVAIVTEVAATALLPRSSGFTDPFWTVVVLIGYGASFWLLSLVVRTVPVSVTYAVWSAAGTAIVAAIGVVALGESMSWIKGASLAVIIIGVVGLFLAEAH